MAAWDENGKPISDAPSGTQAWDENGNPVRHGATGSWGGFTEGVKDAVTAPFKTENWKSLTDNPIVNPLRSEMQTPDMLTSQNLSNSQAESADIQNRVNLVKNGHSPVSPYEAGSGLASAVMAGTPEAVRSGVPALIDSRAASVTGGALKGGARAAVTPIDFRGIPVPASLAGGGMGSLAGYPFGTVGRVIGAGVGASLPFVRGAVEGGRRAGELFDLDRAPMPEPRPAFQGHNFTPPVFDQSPPTGKPGAVLPSGSIVGPASPSRINPPEPRGSPPRVPQWQRMGITGQPQPGTPDASPIYPASPVLESGHVIGPRPGEMPNPSATVVNGGARPSAAVSGPVAPPPVAPAPIQSSGIPRIGQTPGERIAAVSQSPEGTVGTRAEMMRQLRLADQSGASVPEKAAIIRRFEAPEYTPRPDRPFVDPRESQIIAPEPPSVPDTPATVQSRVGQARAKFDANGKRNQLK